MTGLSGTWAEAVPNLLIGLREGLEAGLVVSILLAAVRKSGGSSISDGTNATESRPALSTRPIWFGVLGAVSLAASFAAVLTYSTSVLSSRGQEAVGGLLSVLAVGLVTGMVFWMRATAASLSAQLRGEVARAAALGAGALTLTAFLAVGREGLETSLFLWTAVRASGSTVAPLVGAGLGLAAAVTLCWLLYRRAVRLNIGVFFNRTAIALIVIAAGVLSYGLGDLQDAGLLTGQQWIAFDLTAHLDAGTWWVALISGVTDLAPKLTVLQAVAWVGYLAVVVPAFVRAGKSAAARGTKAAAAPEAAAPKAAEAVVAQAPAGAEAAPAAVAAPELAAAPQDRWQILAAQRPWAVAGVLIAVPVLGAGAAVAALPAASASATTTIDVTSTACAPGWSAAGTGQQTFAVDNQTTEVGEMNLEDASGATWLARSRRSARPPPPPHRDPRSRHVHLQVPDVRRGHASSAPVAVAGPQQAAAPAAFTPVTLEELVGPNKQYQAYAATDLARLPTQIVALRADLAAGNLTSRPPRLAGRAADLGARSVRPTTASATRAPRWTGCPTACRSVSPTRVSPACTGSSTASTTARAPRSCCRPRTRCQGVATVQKKLTTDDKAGDPTNLPLRVHEIIEDALRDHLSGIDDEGAGAAYARPTQTRRSTGPSSANSRRCSAARSPGLVATADQQLDALDKALLATQTSSAATQTPSVPGAAQWASIEDTPRPPGSRSTPPSARWLETLARVPDLLEVPPTA